MNRQTKTTRQEPRSSQLDRLFPQGVPGLWALLITHYNNTGQINWPRMDAHLAFVKAHVKGVVFAAPQGDGGPLDAKTCEQLMTWADKSLNARREFFMIAMNPSQPDTTSVLNAMRTHVDGVSPDAPSSFTGVWAQLDNNSHSLDELVNAGLPVGLEPATTSQNAAATSTTTQAIASLAQQNEHILYAGDASADDQLARSSDLPAGVFRLRTAEGDYSHQLGSSGGPYHGLLLTSANHFPQQLAQLVLAPALGKWDEAHALSTKLTSFYKAAVALQDQAANASPNKQAAQQLCKAIDHHMAHGPAASATAADTPPLPYMQDGKPLPADLIKSIGELLARHDLLPETGYLV